MPITRIPLSQPIETRDGTLTKDSKSVNGYFESRDQKREFIKRPGITTLTTLPTGDGQGLFYFQNQLYAAVANHLYAVNADGTYTSIGTMNGDINTCYFTQSSPVPVISTNTASGNLTLTVPGTTTWTVPTGVTLIYATVVGGGGGGGGFYGSGDNHAGGGGGSGGYYQNQAVLVSPGETLTFTIGAKGGSASFEFNGSFICTGTAYGTTGTYWNGKPGGDSYIQRAGVDVLRATGGGAGLGAGPGDNYGSSAPGAGGLPNGVAGTAGQTQRNNYTYAPGGVNITGYGSGGHANGTQPSYVCPTEGLNGAIIINY
jgi:hypothetical protein